MERKTVNEEVSPGVDLGNSIQWSRHPKHYLHVRVPDTGAGDGSRARFS